MNDAQLRALCQRHQAVLINVNSDTVHIAVVDSPSQGLLDALRFATQKRIDLVCWTQQQMESHLHKPQQAPSAAIPENSPTAAGLLHQTLQTALAKRASDIHIEPSDNHYRIRLRVDGVLHALPNISSDTGTALTARLKVLGHLDIAEHRLPQDGQFTIELTGSAVSFRIATLPCRGGEKVVLRLLHQVNQALDIKMLGMQESQLTEFMQALQQPQGLVLVTGQPGAEKQSRSTAHCKHATCQTLTSAVWKIRSRSPLKVSTRHKFTLVRASPFRAYYVRCCARTPISSWLEKSATEKRRKLPLKQRRPAIWFSLRCIPTQPLKHWSVCSKWAWRAGCFPLR